MALQCTNLIGVGNTDNETDLFNVTLSDMTLARRNQLKSGIDDFASFTWRGVRAFETFGAFIINNKDSLKFYNGPTYSNSYTKPQFESAYGQLTGITFNIQKIDFTIGVYWISEDHYRKLIYWLNPYEVNTLTFGFEPNYYYQVKLASVDNGTRYIVGKEGTENMYYTEMKLSFEVQGPACAYATHAYEENYLTNKLYSTDGIQYEYNLQCNDFTKSSDLPVPIKAKFRFNLYTTYSSFPQDFIDYYDITLEVSYNDNNPITLFNIDFKNLTYTNNLSSLENYLDLRYESDTGLLLYNLGDSTERLINLMSTSQEGKRIVNSMTVNHFEIPGTFDNPYFNLLQHTTPGDPDPIVHKGIQFRLIIRSNVVSADHSSARAQWFNPLDNTENTISARARTNLI